MRIAFLAVLLAVLVISLFTQQDGGGNLPEEEERNAPARNTLPEESPFRPETNIA